VEGGWRFDEYLLAPTAPGSAEAVCSARLGLTRAELADLAADYADRFDEHGLRAGDVVVLELAPRPEAVALMIAAASRAIVFVNISPELPAARKRHILDRVGAGAHIGGSAGTHPSAPPLVGTLSEGGRLVLRGGLPPRAEPRPPRPDDLLYIVFTSGSTGTPKGITMSHRAVVSFWRGFCGFGVRPGVRLGSMSPLQFDFFVLDLGMALGAGGTLVLLPSVLSHQPSGFVRSLRRHRIQQMNGVPAIWRALVADPQLAALPDTELDTLLYAGEAFPLAGLRAIRAAHPRLRIVNGFGHSESIACAYNVLGDVLADEYGRVPFGTRAIDGMRMYLVDETGRVVTAPGVPGEIYIEGAALFDGYWRDERATAAALVPSPVSGPGVLAFASGDVGYRDRDGQHYFHSRRDSQVKLLGNRIELAEIDLRLLRHPAVAEVATVLEDSAQPALVAFVLLSPGQHGDRLREELREHCASQLPRYMVPARIEFVSSIPTTVNGKVDRTALVSGAASS
jgi:amino acid adenylation domain-containing protein